MLDDLKKNITEKVDDFLELFNFNKKELDKLKTEVETVKTLTDKEKLIKKFVDKELKEKNSPINFEMILKTSKEYNVSVEYLMAFMKNDSNYGTE
jgi:hypothetical protein